MTVQSVTGTSAGQAATSSALTVGWRLASTGAAGHSAVAGVPFGFPKSLAGNTHGTAAVATVLTVTRMTGVIAGAGGVTGFLRDTNRFVSVVHGVATGSGSLIVVGTGFTLLLGRAASHASVSSTGLVTVRYTRSRRPWRPRYQRGSPVFGAVGSLF